MTAFRRPFRPMTALMRRLANHDSVSPRFLVPGLLAIGAVAVTALLLPVAESVSGRNLSGVVLVATAFGGAFAIVALVAVEIANVRLVRTTDVQDARMRAMMTAMNDGVLCIDERGRLNYLNPSAERLLGRSFEDHPHAALDTVFPLRQRDGSANDQDSPLLACILAGRPYARQGSVVCADGAILPVDVRMAPIVLQGERAGAVLAFTDDTDRSRQDQAKDDFVSFASHELRSPLTAMHGFSFWLARKLEREPWRFDADTAEAIAALASETGRMESIIELFLDLTQIRMGRLSLDPDVVDLATLLREEGASVRSRYPAAVLEESFPAERVLAIMDEQRLRQSVLNLLDNAAKYGGTEPQIVLSLTASDGIAEVRVKDSGLGIPHEDQQHIFERFFRSTALATGSKKGFGIGLYVTKQIVERMGGELSFVSQEGSGTEFRLRLPLALDEVIEEESVTSDEDPVVDEAERAYAQAGAPLR